MLGVASEIVKILHGNDVDPSKYIEHVVDRKINDLRCNFQLSSEVVLMSIASMNAWTLRYSMSCDKLIALGWAPRVSWEDGIRSTVEWYKKVEDDHWADWHSALRPHPKVCRVLQCQYFCSHLSASWNKCFFLAVSRFYSA